MDQDEAQAANDRMIEAWREAGNALGIEVIVPFSLATDDGPLEATALVVGFGYPRHGHRIFGASGVRSSSTCGEGKRLLLLDAESSSL